MRVIVDSNKIQTQELYNFLEQSHSNRAVVTDWLMIEAYKGDTLGSIYKSLGVLAKFPKQVIVLKNTGMCMGVPVGPQMANRLIWKIHTDNFSRFIFEVAQARDGDPLIEEMLLFRGEAADRRIQQMREQSNIASEIEKALIDSFTTNDVNAIRGRGTPPPDIIARIAGMAELIASSYRQNLNTWNHSRQIRKLVHDFLFRVGLLHVCRTLELIRTGGRAPSNQKHILNDYIDGMMSVYGTYFNGVMTGDSKLSTIHTLHRALLLGMGGKMPPRYGDYM